MNYRFFRVACASPQVIVADCEKNVDTIIAMCKRAEQTGVEFLVLPELSITSYTCSDLFLQTSLIEAAKKEAERLAEKTKNLDMLIAVGCPILYKSKLFNCALFILRGKIIAAIPKTHIPNYSEFYEGRHFSSANEVEKEAYIRFGEDNETYKTPLSSKIVVAFHKTVIGAEICEDLWVPSPPSTKHVQAGALIIANLSASNEVVSKGDYRKMLVQSQSARCACAYLYANAGNGESSQDLIFSAHNIIAENGTILKESSLYQEGFIIQDIDIDLLEAERKRANTWPAVDNSEYLMIEEVNSPIKRKQRTDLLRYIDPHPFVPSNETKRKKRCGEIIAMQAEGLAKRLKHIGCSKIVIGLSGGLDSTLALLVANEAFKRCSFDTKGIIAVTMPCFGTTDRTYENACTMAHSMGVTLREIVIKDSVRTHFNDIGHDESNHNVTYENSQARERTQILMDIANQCSAIVIGTGDLSELALGWATYNGDHMSMYGVNASIPKTLVRYLVSFCSEEAKKMKNNELTTVLNDILDTPVSPELLPPKKDGKIAQKTEDLVGPYELHDFFLYYMVRRAYTPTKIFFLAQHAFIDTQNTLKTQGYYDKPTILKWLKVFYRRFFMQQFKRSCLPDGAKVGTVSLSPRGDWRMPSDASAKLWLKEIESLE